ncbi:MAG: protease pro-enzyme activation domain-containing protein, partial [Thermoplasmata archaeon]
MSGFLGVSRWKRWSLAPIFAVAVALLFFVPTAAFELNSAGSGSTQAGALALSTSELQSSPLATVAYTEPGFHVSGATVIGPTTSISLNILVVFGYSNESELQTLLSEVSDSHSPFYRHYLTQAQFDLKFGQSPSFYNSASAYFSSAGATNLQSYADRSELSFQLTPAAATGLFHTSILNYVAVGKSYYAPSSLPELPAPIARHVASVEGLSSYSQYQIEALHSTAIGSAAPSLRDEMGRATDPEISPSGYLTPPTIGGVQLEYAPDFQVAYDQLSLFSQYGFPTNAVVATILWSGNYTGSTVTTPYGTLTNGENVGPFVPTDVYNFYNETIPAGQPHSQVFGAPVDGAPYPSGLASWDTAGAYTENTLDLEMVGSTAPGSSIYNVYGPTATQASLDTAFDYVLNPNASTLPLLNVSVISNSWGGSDTTDVSWAQATQQAEMRGITVLASSGDSGDNPASPKNCANPGQNVCFPASMAFDNYGTVAVGGTTITLNASLDLATNIVWNISESAHGGPAGSTGGISTVYAEPSWQANTSADDLILGEGRGVPDIAAVANNTLVTLSEQGYEYRAINATHGGNYVYAWGTSIASPVEAGIFADADHVLAYFNNGWLGFADPQIYSIANVQYAALMEGNVTGYEPTGTYASSLPTLPFFDIYLGANDVYYAQIGYDLVTGWGSVDAYNFTMYFTSYQPIGVPGDLSAVDDQFNLTGLNVTSTINPPYGNGEINTFFNASIQQNFFLANSFGAPIDWVQNVIYIAGTPGDWAMNFSGWSVTPFFGLYPTSAIYQYNFPEVGLNLSTPLDFNIETQLINTTQLANQSVEYSFGIPGTSPLWLSVPGASYIIGGLWYNYSWQGQTYTNGPYPGPYGEPGGLSPQFGLVGGPSGGTGNFLPPTAGNLQATFERFGTSKWLPGATQSFLDDASQTGESASNITWVQTTPADYATGAPANWSMSYLDGAAAQGVLEYDPLYAEASFPVQFNESGLPTGSTWQVALSGGPTTTSMGTTLVVYLANGTYAYTITGPHGYIATPSTGDVTVTGSGVSIDVSFVLSVFSLTFSERGLPTATGWTVVVTPGGALTGSTNTLSITNLTDGSYGYAITTALAGWDATPPSGTTAVDNANQTVDVTFAQVEWTVTFTASGLPSGSLWSVTIGTQKITNTSETTASFLLANASYTFTITAPSGYSASPSGGTITVDGQNVQKSISISKSSSTSGTLLGIPLIDWALIAIVIIVIAAVAAIASSRRGRTQQPPPTGPPPA